MKKLSKFRPSPAMVVACIALVVSLAGTSYAAVTLPRNSVGTKQLKRDAVTSIKIKNNAVTGADVLESSLAKVRFAKTADTATSVGADAVGSANVVNASSGAGLRKADIAAVVTTATFDPPSVPANSCGSVLGVVPGAQLGDSIVLQPTGSAWGTVAWMPWLVNSANSVEIRVCNPTNLATDPGVVTFQVLLFR
jgi:hypothetical protein